MILTPQVMSEQST